VPPPEPACTREDRRQLGALGGEELAGKESGEDDAPSSGSQPNAMLFFFMPLRPHPSELDEDDDEDEPVDDEEEADAVESPPAEDQATDVELALPFAAPTNALPADALACDDDEPDAAMLDAILEWWRRWQPAATVEMDDAPRAASVTRLVKCMMVVVVKGGGGAGDGSAGAAGRQAGCEGEV